MARTPLAPLRRAGRFRRQAGQRRPRAITLIVCEGETEQCYLEAVKRRYGLSGITVIVASGSAPINVVETAVKRSADQGGYDFIFCVFDSDQHESFERALARIEALRTRVRNPLILRPIVSVPCFDFWVLLHFQRTDAPFAECQQVGDRIRREHDPHYRKGKVASAERLVPRLDAALAHAHWLEERSNVAYSNPSTQVQQLILHLKKQAPSATD